MPADCYGNELKVGDEVVVFYEVVFHNDARYRIGVLTFIDDNKKTAKVKYTDSDCTLSISRECVVLASESRVTLELLLQS